MPESGRLVVRIWALCQELDQWAGKWLRKLQRDTIDCMRQPISSSVRVPMAPGGTPLDIGTRSLIRTCDGLFLPHKSDDFAGIVHGVASAHVPRHSTLRSVWGLLVARLRGPICFPLRFFHLSTYTQPLRGAIILSVNVIYYLDSNLATYIFYIITPPFLNQDIQRWKRRKKGWFYLFSPPKIIPSR